MKQEQSQNKAFQQSQDYNQQTPSHSNPLRNIKNNAYFDFQQECKPIVNQFKEPSDANFQLDSQKLELVNQMLHILGYKKSVQALQAEINRRYQCRNPENSSAKKKISQKSDASLNVKIQNIVNDNTSFEEMLQSLSYVLKQQNNQSMVEQKPDYYQQSQAFRNPNLQRAVQNLFPVTQTITLPIYKQLEIECANREIKFVDIQQEGNICLFDNHSYLYVVTAQNRSKLNRNKVDQKRHIIDLKWVNSQLIVLLTYNNKILFYNSNKLQNIKTVKNHKLIALTHQICVLKASKVTQAKSCYVLSVSQHRFVPVKLNIEGNNISDEAMPYFQQNYTLKAVTVIKIPHKVTFHRTLEKQSEQKQFNIVTDIQHFYGLAKNSKKIIKFDTIVQKSGVIWECAAKETVWQLKNSNCGYFLQVLLISQQKSKSSNFRDYKLCSFVKMSGSGCVLQKTDLSLTNLLNSVHLGFDQIFQKLIGQNKGLKWHKMSPQWIRCYSYKNNLIYFSIKSGNVIFNQQIEDKDIKIHGVGKLNNVIYQSNGKLVLLSTVEKNKSSLVLQNRRTLDMRETLIQRFSRLHGIPENLLLLLRSIRNNDIELMEIGD